MSPPSAVRSVISTYLHDTNSSVASASTVTATKKNSRVRMERKYYKWQFTRRTQKEGCSQNNKDNKEKT